MGVVILRILLLFLVVIRKASPQGDAFLLGGLMLVGGACDLLPPVGQCNNLFRVMAGTNHDDQSINQSIFKVA